MIKKTVIKILCLKATYCEFEGKGGEVTIVVQASGIIGKAYTTQTGMEIADPCRDWFAWTQISATERVCGYSELLSSQSGVLDEVYKTATGMDPANPEKEPNGWEQVSPTKRVFVESEDIGGHQRWWVWRRVKQA